MTITWLDRDPHPGAQSTLQPQPEVRGGTGGGQPLPFSPCFSLHLLLPPEGPRRRASGALAAMGTVGGGNHPWNSDIFSVYSLYFNGILWSRLGFRLCALRVS